MGQRIFDNIAAALIRNPIGVILMIAVFVSGLISIFLRVRNIRGQSMYDTRIHFWSSLMLAGIMLTTVLSATHVITYELFNIKALGFITMIKGLIEAAQDVYKATTVRESRYWRMYIQAFGMDILLVVLGAWFLFYW